jgi:hypothetical protein
MTDVSVIAVQLVVAEQNQVSLPFEGGRDPAATPAPKAPVV